MYIERKQDISMFYYIQTILEDEGATNVTVVDDFPTGRLELPTVSIMSADITSEVFELGNRKGHDVRTWFIDVFAKNKSQRDEYAYLIKNKLLLGVPVYDYDEGFPPSVSPTQLGSMSCMRVGTRIIPIFPELVSTLYWRREIEAITYYNKPPV